MRLFSLLIALVSYSFTLSQDLNVQITWNNLIREIPTFAYSVNSPANFNPNYSHDSIFQNQLEYITQRKSLIRLHGWGMIEGGPESWLINGKWNSPKIKEALTPLVDNGYEIMINIPSGPLGENDYLDSDQFALFCADLVQIVNVQHQLNVKFWEIPNEREAGFANPGLSAEDMATLIRKTSQAMKNVDPSIKVGGPATAWVNVDYIASVVEKALPEMDFVTCHTYGGDCTNSVSDALENARYAVKDFNRLRIRLDQISSNKRIPIILSEYNVSYDGCSRIQSTEGAVYDALIMFESIKVGVDASCYWNIAPYSDMSIINEKYLEENAHLFTMLNKYFHGDLVETHTSDSTLILSFASQDPSSSAFAFSLINTSPFEEQVRIEHLNQFPSLLTMYTWTGENAFSTQETNWVDLIQEDKLLMPPYSLFLFEGTFNPSLSLHSDQAKQFVYPNPSNGIINIPRSQHWDRFVVYSKSNKVLSGTISKNELDLSNLAKGIYLLQLIQEKENNQFIKVVLQ